MSRATFAKTVRDTILATIERVPTSEQPDEGFLSLVDNGTLTRFGDKRSLANFKGGKWVRSNGGELPFVPTIWLRFKPTEGGAGG